MTQRVQSFAESRAAAPVRVRISWAPFTTALTVEELSVSGVALVSATTFHGGEVEFPVPAELLLSLFGMGRAPRLRWRLASGGGIDEMRVEISDPAGRWSVAGELLGEGEGQRVWTQERQIKGLTGLFSQLRVPALEREELSARCAG